MDLFRLQWYPGHMEKARRALPGILKHVQFVVEVADARAPASTRNPDLIALASRRPRLLVLAKADLADPGATAKWLERLAAEGERAVAVSLLDSKVRRTIADAVTEMVGVKNAGRLPTPVLVPGLVLPRSAARTARGLVVGIPNTGKSTLIRLFGGRAEKADRPGVTRGVQEFSLGGGLTLLDSPGLLWPRAAAGPSALRLVWLGCVGHAAYDALEAGRHLAEYLSRAHPDRIAARYNLSAGDLADPGEVLRRVAARRGFVAGGEPDLAKAAQALMADLQSGRLGPITLERPGEEEDAP